MKPIERRLAEIEAAARRLLGPEPDDPAWPLGFLSWGELGRLEFALERGEPEAAELWPELHRRAVARALLGFDADALDRQEREGCRLLSMPNPDRPGDRLATLYIDYIKDLVVPDLWHMEAVYRGQHRALPATLTTAEMERFDPRPWPPTP